MSDETVNSAGQVPAEQSQDFPTQTGEKKDQFTFDPVTNTVVFPDGKTLPLSELGQGYLRQQDYTRKTQELAALRQRVQSWVDFADAIKNHPRGKDIEKEVLSAWNKIVDKYAGGAIASDNGQPAAPAEEQGELTEEQKALALLEYRQEMMDYERRLGRPLSDEERYFIDAIVEASDGEKSIADAHKDFLVRFQRLSKHFDSQKRLSAAPGGGADVVRTGTQTKSPKDMTPDERRAALRAGLAKLLGESS